MAKLNSDAIWRRVESLPWCGLVTTGRTGSDFFQSLLDSHPEVFVFNGWLFFHDFWDFAYTLKTDMPDTGDIVDEFIGHHIHKFKSRYDLKERKDQLGENADRFIDIDLLQFKANILSLLDSRPLNSRNFLIAVYIAYASCVGQNLESKHLFFHHVHHISKLDRFLEDFPNSKVISMTRDPRAAYVSGVEHWRAYSPDNDHAEHALIMLRRTIIDAQALLDKPINFRTLRLEDLGKRSILMEVCEWLGISYHSCMNNSTWGGLRWWGDRLSMSSIKVHEYGYSKSITKNDWRKALGKVEQLELRYLLADRLAWFQYEKSIGIRADLFFLCLFSILFPGRYERRFLSPRYLLNAWKKRKYRHIVMAFICYPRRAIVFYQLLFRKLSGAHFQVPFFGMQRVK